MNGQTQKYVWFSVYSYPQDIKDIHFILLPIKQLPTYYTYLFSPSFSFKRQIQSIRHSVLSELCASYVEGQNVFILGRSYLV